MMGFKRDGALPRSVFNKKKLNVPEADVLPGVADFDFAFVRFDLGANVDSSSWSGLLEDEVVEEEESLEADST